MKVAPSRARITALALVLALLLQLGAAVPVASASTLRVSASAHVHLAGDTPSSVSVSAKTSTSAQVHIVVYRGGHAIRSLSVHRSGRAFSATWDLRDSHGSKVALGTYSYRVTATAHGTVKRVSHSIKLVRRATSVSTPAQAVLPSATSSATPVSSRWFGYYVSGNLFPDTTALCTLESQTGAHAGVVNIFVADTDTFPTSRCNAVNAHGSIPMVTLEFSSVTSGGDASITNGAYDTKLKAFADAAKAYGHELRLRPFHEMNGNWYPWCGTVGSNTPAKLIAAWKHVHDIFVSRGATNVKFVWCVNSESVPNTSANAIGSYWPGDAYVDFTAIDAYNFGTYVSGGTWKGFATIVSPAYAKLTSLSSKPLFLAESGSVEQGGSKATWVGNMFKAIPTSFPRITGVCWFNVLDGEDWRVNSSPSSLSAFCTGLKTY